MPRRNKLPTPCRYVLAALLLVSGSFAEFAEGNDDHDVDNTALRVAVVGGLVLSGVWPELETLAEAALGFQIDTVLAAPKERIVPAFVDGDADLMLIHGGDETFALQALGHALPAPVWGFNEFAIVGPDTDPAGIRGARSGAEAMARIHAANAPIVAFRDAGSHTILQRLIKQAGLLPADYRFVADSARQPQEVLTLAAQSVGYALVGHIPVALGRMPSPGIEVLVRGDPLMRRAYVVVRPGPVHPAGNSARRRAEQLAEFLIGNAVQQQLRRLGPEPAIPWLFPLADSVLPLP